MKWPAPLLTLAMLGATTCMTVQAQGQARGQAQDPSQAQPVFRCGSDYSQAPCPQGKVVDTSDPRTPQQRAQAQRVNASEVRRGAEMRAERLADEAAQKAPPAAASLSGAPAANPASSAASAPRKAPKRKHASAKKPAGTPFTARDPSRPKQPHAAAPLKP